jgi:hypothetical protein
MPSRSCRPGVTSSSPLTPAWVALVSGSAQLGFPISRYRADESRRVAVRIRRRASEPGRLVVLLNDSR